MARIIVLIPARLASTRFRGKPLALIAGKSMIQRVYENCNEAGFETYVVTDHQEIEDHVKTFSGKVLRVDDDVPSGSERIALAFLRYFKKEEVDLVINVQGDEPLLKGNCLNDLASFHLNSTFQMATLVKERSNLEEDFKNPNIVKALFVPKTHQCLYFSRAQIPIGREITREHSWYQHIGVYSFLPEVLLAFVKLPLGVLEDIEKLEQLRALENQLTIGAVLTTQKLIGVDVPQDIKRVEEALKK